VLIEPPAADGRNERDRKNGNLGAVLLPEGERLVAPQLLFDLVKDISHRAR